MTYCDSPGQSIAVGVGAGLFGGLAGVALSLDLLGVVLLAATLAVVGELAGHALRGDLAGLGSSGEEPTGEEATAAYTDPTRR